MMRTRTTGYIGKSGTNRRYKIVATFKKDGKERVKLESYGKDPITFWVDREKLCDPPPASWEEDDW